MKRPLVYNSFEGGLATDLKLGIKNSFAPSAGAGSLGSYAIDFRKNPSQFSVLPGMAREDAHVVNDLIQNEVMAPDGTIYAIGSAGSFYKRTTAGAWSVEAGINVGTFGLSYRKDTDNIYIPTRKSVSLYSSVSSSPAMYMNYYGPSYSTYDNSVTAGFNVAAFQQGSSKTYTTLTAISENSTDKRFFQSDIEPLTKISIFVVSKGTGDWTLTLHDGNNKVMGTSTVTNANLTNNTFNDFSFTNATNGQVRIYVAPNARTYHLHVTSTVADGTLSCSTAKDMSTCDLEVWADRLVQTNNGMHPWTRFLQYECIGNGNYLSVWEPISDPPTNDEWLRHKLVFPMEYEMCGVASTNEFVVVALEKNTSSSTSIPQEGIIAYWDGTASTYNYFFKVPEGSPYGLHEYKNAVYYFAGGDWWGVAPPSTTPVKIRRMPGSDTEFSGAAAPLTVYPYSATVRRGIHLSAFPSMTTNTSINYGVYSWGAVDKNYPDSFGYSYLLSTGSTNYSAQNNLTIGMVKNFGDTLHVSWRDDQNGGYGIDVVNNASAPATSSAWESLIWDGGFTPKKKKAIRIYVNFLTLPADASFKIKYKLDRASSWTYSQSWTSANAYANNIAWIDVSGQNYFYECQVGIDITSGATAPTFTAVTLIYDDTREEPVGGG